MKKITIVMMMMAITLTTSAQNTVDNLISKLLKSYPKTPSREMIDKDIDTGKLQRRVSEYSFRDINPKKLKSLINALRNPENGYYCYSQGNPHDTNDYILKWYPPKNGRTEAQIYILYGPRPNNKYNN